jgi:hypothetical protein
LLLLLSEGVMSGLQSSVFPAGAFCWSGFYCDWKYFTVLTVPATIQSDWIELIKFQFNRCKSSDQFNPFNSIWKGRIELKELK